MLITFFGRGALGAGTQSGVAQVACRTWWDAFDCIGLDSVGQSISGEFHTLMAAIGDETGFRLKRIAGKSLTPKGVSTKAGDERGITRPKRQ